MKINVKNDTFFKPKNDISYFFSLDVKKASVTEVILDVILKEFIIEQVL
jgi:hypothetical protein